MTMVQIIFICLNCGLYLGIGIWYLKTKLIPALWASWRDQEATLKNSADDIPRYADELAQAEQSNAREERDIARLTVCVEQWVGMLEQRAVATADDARLLAQRYRERCVENARARVLQEAERIAVRQALKNARVILKQKYADTVTEQEYTNTIIDTYCAGDMHERS